VNGAPEAPRRGTPPPTQSEAPAVILNTAGRLQPALVSTGSDW
jgi:hypothetical protein